MLSSPCLEGVTAACRFFQREITDGDPPRVYQCILESCASTTDIVALLQVSRRIYGHWEIKENAATILWPRYRRKIPYFEDAIVAVRSLRVAANTKCLVVVTLANL